MSNLCKKKSSETAPLRILRSDGLKAALPGGPMILLNLIKEATVFAPMAAKRRTTAIALYFKKIAMVLMMVTSI